MIHPKISESVWLKRLNGLPAFDLPSVHTLIIAPHPDDETLAAGGLIAALRARNIEVSVIAVTDGENAYESESNLGPIREVEQTNALGVLGVPPQNIHRLHITDSDVASWKSHVLSRALDIASDKMHLLAPWIGDFHPDHEVCGEAAQDISRIKRIPLTSYLFWTWHRGEEQTLTGLSLKSLSLTPEEQRLKKKALHCHQSQLERAGGSPILPENLLGPAYRPFEVFITP